MAKSVRRRKPVSKSSKPQGGKAKVGKSGLTPNPKASTLAGRLRAVAGPITFREVGQRTGTHPENARRYLQGGSVGLKFIKSFCREFNVSADWLLEGIGPMERKAR